MRSTESVPTRPALPTSLPARAWPAPVERPVKGGMSLAQHSMLYSLLINSYIMRQVFCTQTFTGSSRIFPRGLCELWFWSASSLWASGMTVSTTDTVFSSCLCTAKIHRYAVSLQGRQCELGNISHMTRKQKPFSLKTLRSSLCFSPCLKRKWYMFCLFSLYLNIIKVKGHYFYLCAC